MGRRAMGGPDVTRSTDPGRGLNGPSDGRCGTEGADLHPRKQAPGAPLRTALRGARSERQLYALAHPSSDPRGLLTDKGLWSDEVARDGNVLRTALAVDR